MSLKRHRPQRRTAAQPLRIAYQGQVISIGEPVIFLNTGRIVYPWRLSPRQRRRILTHTKGHELPVFEARGYHRRIRSRRGRTWRRRFAR